MNNVREIRNAVENAEKAFESIGKQKDRADKMAVWKDAQALIATARALLNVGKVNAKDADVAADRHFIRRAVLELIDGVEQDAMKIDLG